MPLAHVHDYVRLILILLSIRGVNMASDSGRLTHLPVSKHLHCSYRKIIYSVILDGDTRPRGHPDLDNSERLGCLIC